ncbi:MAG: hypothetical protein ACFFGZ_02550 [Candidatus Thorarchaeota archaeon]
MKTNIFYLAVRIALLLGLFCLMNPGWTAIANGADPVIVTWDNSGGGPHDVYYMYAVGDQEVWNDSLDYYGATRTYTNATFSAAYFEGVTAAIIPMPNREASYTAAEATAIKDFVDDGGRVLLTGYYDKGYWNYASTNMVAAKWGVEYLVTEGANYSINRYCQVAETAGNYYGDYNTAPKVKNLADHMITEGVTEYYARGGSLDISGSDAKALATGSETAYYNTSATNWVNGTDIVYMAIIENDNGGGILFTYTPYILRNEYTKLHGEENGYNGSKLPDNISNWLVNGSPKEEEDSPGFEAIMIFLVLVPLAIPVLRRRR